MKFIISTCLLYLLLFTLFIGCSKSNSAPDNTPTNVSAAVTTGNWIVSSYTQKGEDKTSDFGDMVFTFQTGGKLVVSGSMVADGTWSITPSSAGYYGAPPSLATFTISLGNTKPLDNLSKAWNIADSSNTLLKLDNKEPMEDEHVTFMKK